MRFSARRWWPPREADTPRWSPCCSRKTSIPIDGASGHALDRRGERGAPRGGARALLESRRCDPGAPQGEDETLVPPARRRARPSKRRAGQKPERAAPRAGPGRSAQTDDPLTLACARGDVAAVELLLKHGANPDGGGEGTRDTPSPPRRGPRARGRAALRRRRRGRRRRALGRAHRAGGCGGVRSAGRRRLLRELLARGADANSPAPAWWAAGWATAPCTPPPRAWIASWSARWWRRARTPTGARGTRTWRTCGRAEPPPPRARSGAGGAAERLDNTPLHLAVAAYINEAAKRRVAENQLKTKHAMGSMGSTTSKLVELETPLEKTTSSGTPFRRLNRTNPANPANPETTHPAAAAPAASLGEGERAALEVVKTLLLAAPTTARSWWTRRLCTWRRSAAPRTPWMRSWRLAPTPMRRAPNGYTTPLEAAARYAADIILDRRDEREARVSQERGTRRIRRRARRRRPGRAPPRWTCWTPRRRPRLYRDDSDDDSFVDDALDELAGEADDDDDDGGDGSRGVTPLMRRFGWTDKLYAQGGLPAGFGHKISAGIGRRIAELDAASDRPSRSPSSDSDSDSYYDGSRGDDDAAMAALRDAEARGAARHLVQR